MLVRIKLIGKMGFMVPIPFYVLDIIVDAIGDLAWVADLSRPIGLNKLQKHLTHHGWGHIGKQISFAKVLNIFQELISELRKYGRWRLVEVKTEDVQVSIDLY